MFFVQLNTKQIILQMLFSIYVVEGNDKTKPDKKCKIYENFQISTSYITYIKRSQFIFVYNFVTKNQWILMFSWSDLKLKDTCDGMNLPTSLN